MHLSLLPVSVSDLYKTFFLLPCRQSVLPLRFRSLHHPLRLLFCGRLRQLQTAGADTERLAALFAANLNFTAERILEDYYYQKLVHPQLRQKLEAFGINPVELDSEDKTATEQYIQGKLSLQAYKLLHDNLGRTPFYQQNGQSYYLRDLSVGAKLPWA